MENTLLVAKALYNMYYERYETDMDEMKMHKLMYFAQRESLMYNNTPLFDGDFYGWRYGPVLKEVRNAYKNNILTSKSGDVSEDTQKLLQEVLNRYGSLSSWKLSSLSHNEFSWKKARVGLNPADNGNVKLSLNAIQIDAIRELVNRKQEMV